MTPASAWIFFASGKHPVVKDYIRIGSETPLMDGFSRWVENGDVRVNSNELHHSWRFFARGLGKEELSCGLVRDSRDRAGRPFPLLIMGCGRLPGWEGYWEHLPFAFDAIWERMEFLSGKHAYDLEALKGDIKGIPSPLPPKITQDINTHEVASMEIHNPDEMFSIPLQGETDHGDEIARLLAGTRIQSRTLPDTVFIGGTFQRSFLVAFTRPLKAEDFVKLWTMS